MKLKKREGGGENLPIIQPAILPCLVYVFVSITLSFF